MISARLYAKKDKTLYDLWSFMADDLTDMFFRGVTASRPRPKNDKTLDSLFSGLTHAALEVQRDDASTTFHFSFVALKGDWVFLRKAMSLRTGWKSARVCHQCPSSDPLTINLARACHVCAHTYVRV